MLKKKLTNQRVTGFPEDGKVITCHRRLILFALHGKASCTIEVEEQIYFSIEVEEQIYFSTGERES